MYQYLQFLDFKSSKHELKMEEHPKNINDYNPIDCIYSITLNHLEKLLQKYPKKIKEQIATPT